MARCTEVVAGPTAAVIVKRATGPAASSLRAEAERLRAAAHPGVAELLSSSGTDDAWELRLAHAGRPVDVVGAMPVAQIAGVVAAVAATLADLHEGGTVHGRIDGSHVLIGRHGRPVLCGFGPASPGATPADDVAALGTLLAELLASGADMEPIPDRRWWPRRSGSGWERRSLLLIADQACAEPPTRRPTARRLAAATAEAVPGAIVASPTATPAPDELPRDEDPFDALRASAWPDAPRSGARLPALACALAGVIVLGAGAFGLARPRLVRTGAPDATALDEPVSPPGARVQSSTPTEPSSGAAPTRDLPPTTGVPPVPCVAALEAGTAPGACAAVEIEGTTVLVGARRYEVGRPGDVVVLGDWDCDRTATPAVLRPDTGEVFVFTEWASSNDVQVPAIARVVEGVDLTAEPGSGGCATLVVVRADGSRQEVPAGASA